MKLFFVGAIGGSFGLKIDPVEKACEFCKVGYPSLHQVFESVICDRDDNYELYQQAACNCKDLEISEKDVTKIGKSCQSVTDLYLDNNKIEEIEKDTFKGKGFIRLLSMSNNGLTKIHSESFRPLSKLTQLHLDHNELETLPEGILENLVDLQELSVKYNRLHSLPDNVFNGLINLEDIRLSHNFLQGLHVQSLDDTSKLHSLYLDNNNLTSIKQEWFDVFHERWQNSGQTQRGQIFMNQNPWVCDCSTAPFLNWQKGHEFFKDKYNKDEGYVSLGSCQYPKHLQNMLFQDFTDNDINDLICRPPNVRDMSEGKVEVGPGEPELVWITVAGAPPPKVEFFIYNTKDGPVDHDDFEQAPRIMQGLDQDHDGPVIRHSVRVLDHTLTTIFVNVTITSPETIEFPDPIHQSFQVTVDFGRDHTVLYWLFILIMFGGLSYLIFKKHDKIAQRIRGMIPIPDPKTAGYTYVPEDSAALVSNEPEEEPRLKINV